MLRLDLIPKLNFGINRISETSISYYAYAQQFKSDTPVCANYVQVTDHRDIKTGWTLSVQQNRQFKNAEGEELIRYYLSFDNQWVSSTNDVSLAPTIQKDSIVINEMNTAYPIANADVGKGGNTWLISFGSSDDIHGELNTLEPLLNTDGTVLTSVEYDNKPIYLNKAISLTVPGKTKKMSGNYSTVLTWTISELS